LRDSKRLAPQHRALDRKRGSKTSIQGAKNTVIRLIAIQAWSAFHAHRQRTAEGAGIQCLA
jgi:hypothetical protein